MNADVAIARRAFKQIWIGATSWGLVFGSTIASSALTYVSSFPDAASRRLLAATTSHDAGLAVLLGPIATIDTVGGYTVYKCYVFLTTIGAIWAVLATTRLLRGEEDNGRWQLVIADGSRSENATVATLVALGIAVAVVFCGATACTLLAGLDRDVGFGSGESLLYGLSLTIAPAVFVSVAAVTSQLGRTRRLASGLGIGVLGVCFVIRMIADSGPATRWLLWCTPFGWAERMRPLTQNDALPLLPAAITVALLCTAAVALAARRDAGDGVLASRDVVPLRPFGLASPLALAARLELPVLIAWCVGAAATAFSFGMIAKIATGDVPDSISNTLDKFGVQGDFANQYVGVVFLLVATVVALLPAGQIGSAAEDETSGRLVHVLVQPSRRSSLLLGRLTICVGGIAAASLLSGFAVWVGAKSQGIDLDLASMIGAGLNVVPTALVAMGVGAVTASIAPRAAARAVYGIVIWSLLVDLVGSMIESLNGIDRSSIFHYMALAPAQATDPLAIIMTLLVAAVLCAFAIVRVERRDVQTA